jgi:hypothetical protein
MDDRWFDAFSRAIGAWSPRRALLQGALASLVAGLAGSMAAPSEARKRKKKKRKRKKKCGKTGGKPVKGKCCGRAVNVDGRCRACDVCASGCTFATLQLAIDAANLGATIAVCPGTYAGGLTIGKDLRLVGAGAGTGASDTVVQGAGDDSVVTIESGTVVLQNLRITSGSGSAAGGGSGVYIQGGVTLELNDCSVSGNGREGVPGGGIICYGTLHLINSTVSDNAGGAGGGIYSHFGSSVRLTNSEISGNTASQGSGIFNLGSIVFEAASRVTGNTADLDGGGIYNNVGTTTLVAAANVSGNTPNNCAGVPAIALCSG